MMGFEAASEHAIGAYLVGKGRVCWVQCFFMAAKAVVFITEVCGEATNLNIEPVNLLMGMKELEVCVHGKAPSRRCPQAMLNFLAGIVE